MESIVFALIEELIKGKNPAVVSVTDLRRAVHDKTTDALNQLYRDKRIDVCKLLNDTGIKMRYENDK